MKYNLQIWVSDKPEKNNLVACKSITLVFGNMQRITIFVKSKNIAETSITKQM